MDVASTTISKTERLWPAAQLDPSERRWSRRLLPAGRSAEAPPRASGNLGGEGIGAMGTRPANMEVHRPPQKDHFPPGKCLFVFVSWWEGRECGNEPEDSPNGNHRGRLVRVIPFLVRC